MFRYFNPLATIACSLLWTRYFPNLLLQARVISNKNSKISYKYSFCYSSVEGIVFTKDFTSGVQPKISGSKKTIPQRETVAGEATVRSSTSKIIVIWLVSLMISPDDRHSFLLSSNTVFMFSIQTASTGPSKTTHFFSNFSASYTHPLIKIGTTPSVNCLVSGSNLP